VDFKRATVAPHISKSRYGAPVICSVDRVY
jgi:hypothetical protein